MNSRKLLYIDIARRVAKESYATRRQVGAVIVANDNIVSIGFNGTPSGDDNECEHYVNGILVTKPSVIHAEINAISRAALAGRATANADMYITLSPCIACSGTIKQAGIKRVFYDEEYRYRAGIIQLIDLGIHCEKISSL